MIRVNTISQFDGNIPDDLLARIQWFPVEGALFVSGIALRSSMSMQRIDEIDRYMLSNAGIDTWRINRACWVLDSWREQNRPNKSLAPRDFLAWYRDNGAPPLDYRGNPIELPAGVSSPDAQPNDTNTPKETTPPSVETAVLKGVFGDCLKHQKPSKPVNFEKVFSKEVNKQKKLADCRTVPGRQGVKSMWCPVSVGLWLHERGYTWASLNRAFKSVTLESFWDDWVRRSRTAGNNSEEITPSSFGT